MTRRRGRGRLSAIDLLPVEAADAVAWAFNELRERNRTQIEIHDEFNEKLVALGLEPVSYSAFNRHSIRLASMARRHEEVRAITTALTDRLDPDAADDLTIMAAETIKTLVFELMEGSVTPKQTQELANALRAAEAAAKMPLIRKREIEAQFARQVDDAIDKVRVEKGLTDEQAAFFRREVLGVKQ
ncbi:MAG: DUF3486 family protein [Paracoccus sp. (in: a-proteobacteria)]|uniref:DUF3486 family protein n=1 Tax=Paracoccus sp. TaxID=267 RepID=UPI0026E04756|nr:DUF3486 family protein [Paracoccus sp. (in: a-proteobacteria)]MDO5631122.1 DUF3486 family protein [Paracoccus sp. (in: a-proteobacteria)]